MIVAGKAKTRATTASDADQGRVDAEVAGEAAADAADHLVIAGAVEPLRGLVRRAGLRCSGLAGVRAGVLAGVVSRCSGRWCS